MDELRNRSEAYFGPSGLQNDNKNITQRGNKLYYAVQGGSNFWVYGRDEILKCDHSNESYWAVLSCGAVYYAVETVSNV